MKAKLVLGASVVVAAASLLASGRAEAADPGSLTMANKGSLIISADRLFGASFWSAKEKYDELDGAGRPTGQVIENKVSYSKLGLLWGDPSGGFTGFANPFAIPRASIDFLLIDGLTIGGSIGFLTSSSRNSATRRGTTVEADGPTLTEFAFTPRVGYILAFSPNVGLWLRGGFTYWSASSKQVAIGGAPGDSSSSTYNGFALNLEPTLVLSPVDHFAFTAGLVGDIGLGGKYKHERTQAGVTRIDPDHDLTVMNFGLTLGILGWL